MIHIEKPENNVQEIFEDCISNFRDEDYKSRLQRALPFIESESYNYDTIASSNSLFTMVSSTNVNGIVSVDEMEKLYDRKLVKKGQPGRKHYEKIKLSAKYNVCPLCDHRTVTTLDHILPKSLYPTFAVTPFNLVPACGDCNKIKSTYASTSSDDEVVHPYYDDISNEKFLFASLIEDRGNPSFTFYIKTSSPESTIERRLKKHLELLELNELYVANAARKLASINYRLSKLFQNGGKQSVHEHLKEEYDSNFQCNKNSWETAMYEIIYNNDWFCDGGFKLTS